MTLLLLYKDSYFIKNFYLLKYENRIMKVFDKVLKNHISIEVLC